MLIISLFTHISLTCIPLKPLSISFSSLSLRSLACSLAPLSRSLCLILPDSATPCCAALSPARSTEETYANKDIILDPTLPRKMDLCCPRCAAVGPVYYQPSEESMALAYVCRNTACIFSGELKDYRKVGAN